MICALFASGAAFDRFVITTDGLKEDATLDLKGNLLIAMPFMEDDRFARTVVFMCSHNDEGSMGFVLTQPLSSPAFPEILQELDMQDEADELAENGRTVPVFRGGPVEQGRGFVVHTLDFDAPTSMRVDDLACVTATLDALRRLAGSHSPEHFIMLLGYAGWTQSQLENEIQQNAWLTVPATHELLFNTPHDQLYDAALKSMGISEMLLSANAGHA